MKKVTFIVDIVLFHKLTLGGDFVSALRSPVVGPTASTPTLVGSTCAVRAFFWRTTLGLVGWLFATTMMLIARGRFRCCHRHFRLLSHYPYACYRTAKVWLLALIVTPPHSQNTIARCRLRLSAFPVSSWLLVGVEEYWMLCGSHQACLMACLKDTGSDWGD